MNGIKQTDVGRVFGLRGIEAKYQQLAVSVNCYFLLLSNKKIAIQLQSVSNSDVKKKTTLKTFSTPFPNYKMSRYNLSGLYSLSKLHSIKPVDVYSGGKNKATSTNADRRWRQDTVAVEMWNTLGRSATGHPRTSQGHSRMSHSVPVHLARCVCVVALFMPTGFRLLHQSVSLM